MQTNQSEPQKGTMEETHEWWLSKFVKGLPTIVTPSITGEPELHPDFIEALHHQLQKAREEALARERQLKQVHTMELDAISCKSIEEYVLWRDHRKQRPKQAELDQDKV